MRRAPLLERDTEVAAVVAALADAVNGRGRMVVVQGEAGVGKTRLLAGVRELPQSSGVQIFSARCSDLEKRFAFGVVRQLFETAVVTADASGRVQLLSGAARGAAPVFAEGGQAAIDADLAVLHGLYWLTVNLAEQPMIMLVDDAHWADAASLRYLAYLTSRLDDLSVLVVAAVRSAEAATDEAALQQLVTAPETVVLRPDALSEAATLTLLEVALGRPVQPVFAGACHQATAGNPLFLAALAETVARDRIEPTAANRDRIARVGPRAVSHLVSARLAEARPDVRATARAVAVLGAGASVPAVAELARIDRLSAEDAVGRLVRAGLLETEEAAQAGATSLRFVHPLVEAAVYGQMTPRERAEAHAAAGRVLARHNAEPERVGSHVLKTPPSGAPDSVEVLRRAAVVAERRGSAEAALAFLLRCLEEPVTGDERLQLLLDAGRAAVQVDVRIAVGLLEQARALARDPSTIAHVSARLGAAYGFLLDPGRAFDAFHQALEHLPADDEDQRRRLEATLLVGALVVPNRLDVVQRIPELRALPTHDSVGGRMLQAAIAEFEMAACDPAGRERARLAMSDGRLVREANGEGALVCGWLTLLAADDEAGMDSLDAAVGQAHLHGSVRALAAAYCFRALGRVWRGQLGEAEQDAREALRLARTGQVDMDPTFAGAYLADSLIEQGRLAEAETLLSAVGVPGETAPRPVYSALDTYVRLVHQQARHELAVATAAEADRTWSAFGFRNPAFGSWRTSASLSLSALDRVSEARTLAREELDLATTWGAPRALGRALRTVGRVTSGPEAVEFLRRSTSILEQSNARLERAKSLHALGSALRRGGQRTEARRWLARALDDAEICGAKPVADQAAADLRAAGARPRRDRLTGADALTPSERRVADAAAQGATNREIAQALFVTIKTVEVHLSSAFRKLGASRRSDLPGLLHPVQ